MAPPTIRRVFCTPSASSSFRLSGARKNPQSPLAVTTTPEAKIHRKRCGNDQKCRCQDSCRKDPASDPYNRLFLKAILHPSAYDVSKYKGAKCQIKTHGCLSLTPACLLHHIGLINRPYMGISGKKDRKSSKYHGQQTLFFLYSCHNFLL